MGRRQPEVDTFVLCLVVDRRSGDPGGESTMRTQETVGEGSAETINRLLWPFCVNPY